MPTKPGLHINRFVRGLVTNRAATSTPFKYSGLGNVVTFHDALIDGSNMEISPANTLVRRPGWSKYCSVTYGTDVPKGFKDAIINGTLYKFFDTDQKVYLFDASSLTAIYTKGTTAQTRYQQVGNILYFSDGNANQKFTVGQAGDTLVTNAGVASPINAPTIPNLNLYDTVGNTQTVHSWSPSAVYNNTTGSPQNYFFIAPTGEVQWAVVPAGSKLKSQSSAPNWAAGFGALGTVTQDGSMQWTNCGVLKTWAANFAWSNTSYTSVGNFSSAGASPTLAAVGGVGTPWQIGALSAGFTLPAPATGNTNTLNATGFGLAVPAGATITGITVTVNRASNRTNAAKDITVQLLKAGVATGTNKATAGYWPQTMYNAYTIPTSGGVQQIYGSNSDMWGTTWAPSDVNASTFGVSFVANIASSRTTTAALVFPITIGIAYKIAGSDITGTVYSTVITDSNGNLQRVKTSGTSAGSAPTWAKTVAATTTDGTVTWECLGTGSNIPCLFGRSYAYGFHTSSPHLSTMSPLLTLSSPIVGTNVNLQGFGSDDTQVDRNDIYRTADGGSILLYDTTAPNVNSATSWTVYDTALDSDLNPLLIGPVAHANDPPPAGATILAYHMGRMWAAVGNLVYFSAGPDCLNGDGNQAWPPANVFPITGPVTGFATTSVGLVVLSAGTRDIVLGGPQVQTFWIQPLLKARGVANANCLTQDGDEIATYTTARQFFGISSNGENEFGLDVAPTLAANFDPTTSYVTVYRSGQDQGIFISDGSSKIMRYNLNSNNWDPIATIVGGIGPVYAMDLSIGNRALFSAAGGYILQRDTTTNQDNGSSYAAYATVGSIVVSEPGEPAVSSKSFVMTSAAVGSPLALSVLPNEISGSFTNIPISNSDPWQLPASSTINMKEYQWDGVQTALANCLKHLQIKITLATENAKNEIYSLSLMPKV